MAGRSAAALASCDGLTHNSASSATWDNSLISSSGASTSTNSEFLCGTSPSAQSDILSKSSTITHVLGDSISCSGNLASTRSEVTSDSRSYDTADSQLNSDAASSNCGSSGFGSVNNGVAAAICSSTDVPRRCKASWPGSAEQSAILASKHLSGRYVASLLFAAFYWLL